MLNRLLKRIKEDQEGITGLETAIILIAFVVVAAVFAYTVLSAGLFSSQKSSEAVYSGLEEASSTMQLDGAVLGFGTVGDDVVVQGKCQGLVFSDYVSRVMDIPLRVPPLI
jgi:flagellin FlaB